MASMKEALPDFTPLGTNTALYIPSTTTLEPKVDLLILCTWMGAQPKHISKYVATYFRLLPTTRILLIQSTLKEMTFRTFAQQRKNLSAAREVVRSTISPQKASATSRKPHVFLHVFSNGGSYNAVQLFASLREENVEVPLIGMALDSCPGRGSYKRSVEAMALSVPRSPWILRLIGVLWVHCAVLMMILVRKLGGRGIIDSLWKGLYDHRLFAKHVPRCYLYSKGDKMVPWEDVERHIDESKKEGYRVKSIRFDKSPHVGHIMEDGERYWHAVEGTMEYVDRGE